MPPIEQNASSLVNRIQHVLIAGTHHTGGGCTSMEHVETGGIDIAGVRRNGIDGGRVFGGERGTDVHGGIIVLAVGRQRRPGRPIPSNRLPLVGQDLVQLVVQFCP